jgi:cyanophycinase
MTDVFLIGGGRDEAACSALFAYFLSSCASSRPTIAVLILDEGDGAAVFDRFDRLLRATGDCEPVPVLVPNGATFDVDALGAADGLLVASGLTPAYAAALGPTASGIRGWLSASARPYAGFSAGAAIAAHRALVGGYRLNGVAVCDDGAAEDLDELTVVDGLGLTGITVDVHCAQWGTLSRLVAAVAGQLIVAGIGLDENTMLAMTSDGTRVIGSGQAWLVEGSSTAQVSVRVLTAGESVDLPNG